jgi:hypothetical protein
MLKQIPCGKIRWKSIDCLKPDELVKTYNDFQKYILNQIVKAGRNNNCCSWMNMGNGSVR